MCYAAHRDGMLAALHSASILGVHIVDAADVYAWGLTREFAALRAACCARMAAAAAGRDDHRVPRLASLRPPGRGPVVASVEGAG